MVSLLASPSREHIINTPKLLVDQYISRSLFKLNECNGALQRVKHADFDFNSTQCF